MLALLKLIFLNNYDISTDVWPIFQVTFSQFLNYKHFHNELLVSICYILGLHLPLLYSTVSPEQHPLLFYECNSQSPKPSCLVLAASVYCLFQQISSILLFVSLSLWKIRWYFKDPALFQQNLFSSPVQTVP